jgi:branched-chain amino acid aminotransferase
MTTFANKQNGTIFLDGQQADWVAARIPMMSDAVLRAASIFDGMVARSPAVTGYPVLVAGEDHVRRLEAGVRATGMRWRWKHADVLSWCYEAALTELGEDDRVSDVYVRPMVVGADILGLDVSSTLAIAAFRRPRGDAAPVRLKTASWRRPSEDALPGTVKSVANYHISRLSRLEADAAGYDDALLLNTAGRAAETAGAAIVVEKAGVLRTPPTWEGCLPSVTVDILERIAVRLGIEFDRVPLSPVDIRQADGLAVAGTLADVVDVTEIDGIEVPRSSTLSEIRRQYMEASRDETHRCREDLRMWTP